jgi:hypothetical protein
MTKIIILSAAFYQVYCHKFLTDMDTHKVDLDS